MPAHGFVPVIAVLNMKGGVGKTTISANVFRRLFLKRKQSVLLVDLDPQFNLTQSLFTRQQYDELKDQNKTIFSVMEPNSDVGLFEVKTSSLPPPKASEVTTVLRTWYNPRAVLSILPGDFRLVKYSLMDHNKKLAAVRKRFLKFVEEARESFSIIVIDCNPSSSFLTLCALEACTHLLVPVRPDRYSILGLEMLWEFVQTVPSLKKAPELLVLLNGVSRKWSTDVESELRGHATFGARTLAAEIAESKLLKASSDYTGFGSDRRVSWGSVVRAELTQVADEIAAKAGMK